MENHPASFVRSVRFFSYAISPPTMIAALALALSWAEIPSRTGLVWGASYGIVTALIPVLFVVYLLKTGRVKTLSMDRHERRIPYLIGTISALGVWLAFRWLGAPELLVCLALLNALGLAGMGLINWWWQISNHATTGASVVLVSGAVFGQAIGWLLTPLLVVVCLARLYLKKHTSGQLTGGILLGILCVLALMQTGCFGG